jgi:hypothetical protein
MKKIIIIFVIIFISFPLAAEEKLQLRIGTYENAPKIFTDESGKIAGFRWEGNCRTKRKF